jgi:hypothetical protein
MNDKQKITLPLTPGIPLKYDRTGTVALTYDTCDITKETTWVIEVDTSGGEYGPVKVSMKYLNEMLKKCPPVTISKLDEGQGLFLLQRWWSDNPFFHDNPSFRK